MWLRMTTNMFVEQVIIMRRTLELIPFPNLECKLAFFEAYNKNKISVTNNRFYLRLEDVPPEQSFTIHTALAES